MLLGGPAELTHHTTSTARQPPHTHHTHQTSDKGMAPGSIRIQRIPVCVACVARARRLPSRARGAAREPRWVLETLVIKLCEPGKSPRLSRSAKAQVLPERPRSSLYRRLPWPPFYTPLTVSAYACGYQKMSKNRLHLNLPST